MLLGMGVVFALLGLLVLALKLMSRLAATLDRSPPPDVSDDASGGSAWAEVDDPELIAAVTAAIQANRGAGTK